MTTIPTITWDPCSILGHLDGHLPLRKKQVPWFWFTPIWIHPHCKGMVIIFVPMQFIAQILWGIPAFGAKTYKHFEHSFGHSMPSPLSLPKLPMPPTLVLTNLPYPILQAFIGIDILLCIWQWQPYVVADCFDNLFPTVMIRSTNSIWCYKWINSKLIHWNKQNLGVKWKQLFNNLVDFLLINSNKIQGSCRDKDCVYQFLKCFAFIYICSTYTFSFMELDASFSVKFRKESMLDQIHASSNDENLLEQSIVFSIRRCPNECIYFRIGIVQR